MEKITRTSREDREFSTREATERTKSWRPPALLPIPKPQEGVKYRWIRVSTLGQSDNKNVSSRFRENWTPVLAKDHPELMLVSDRKSEFPENVEVGGLLLCKNSIENVEARNRYYAERASDQLASVDNNYLRESDPRMPMLRPERRTTTTKGSPRPTPETNTE